MREVRFLARALADAMRLDAWWRANRSASPDLFRRELTSAVEFLADRPDVSVVFGDRRGETVRRLILPETRAHAYYIVRPDRVVVLRVWGAIKGRPPSLG